MQMTHTVPIQLPFLPMKVQFGFKHDYNFGYIEQIIRVSYSTVQLQHRLLERKQIRLQILLT